MGPKPYWLSMKMKKFANLMIFVALLAACKQEPTTTPQYRPIIEAVYASGKILPADDYKIYAQTDGRILKQLVKEGDAINPQQILFSIEADNQLARLQNASQVYQLAKANLSESSPILLELASQIESARIKQRDDSTNMVRYQSLWGQGATARINVDKAELAYRLSSNELATLRQRWQRTRNQLRLELDNATTTQQISRNDERNYSVRSDIGGMVYELFKKQGESVRRNDVLATVGRANQYYVQVWIDELDVAKVRVGQTAALALDLYKGQRFEGKVTKIYPTLNPENQSVRADLVFEGKPPLLVANAAVEANIIIQTKPKALTIPKKLIQGDSVAIKKADGTTQKVKIEKGIETPDFVEILRGLDANTQLVMQ